jgi:4-diphosphocytidyl-2-C-methyl-D-erythritol kinase
VLVNPLVSCPTGPVFKHFQSEFARVFTADDLPHNQNDWINFLKSQHNMLQPASCSLVPEISGVLSVIEAQSGCLFSRMSGSGATCFGIFAASDDAQNAARNITEQRPDWWVRAAQVWQSPAV